MMRITVHAVYNKPKLNMHGMMMKSEAVMFRRLSHWMADILQEALNESTIRLLARMRTVL